MIKVPIEFETLPSLHDLISFSNRFLNIAFDKIYIKTGKFIVGKQTFYSDNKPYSVDISVNGLALFKDPTNNKPSIVFDNHDQLAYFMDKDILININTETNHPVEYIKITYDCVFNPSANLDSILVDFLKEA